MAHDMNGVVLEPGQRIKVYQQENTCLATVRKVLTTPTIQREGFWVDIEKDGEGVEGLMSYILEVIDAEPR